LQPGHTLTNFRIDLSIRLLKRTPCRLSGKAKPNMPEHANHLDSTLRRIGVLQVCFGSDAMEKIIRRYVSRSAAIKAAHREARTRRPIPGFEQLRHS